MARRTPVLSLALACLLPFATGAANAAETPAPSAAVPGAPPAPPSPPTKAEVEALIAKAQDYLLSQQQADGSYVPAGARLGVGVTALATEGLLLAPALPATDAHIVSAVAYLRAHKQPDGGIYTPDEGLATYGTAVGLLALQAAGATDPALIKGAHDFLFSVQVADAESPSFGGLGYGTAKSAGRADLSNTDLAIVALRATGLQADDEHAKHLVTFLEHCQQLSAHNHLPWVDTSAKEAGGAVYNPDPRPRTPPATAANPNPAPIPATRPTAYASMTYALISSYLEMGVPAEDERVAAGLNWIKANYSPYANPGRAVGKEVDGLYYGYYISSKAFQQLKITTLLLADGKKTVDWRADLFGALAFRAKSGEIAPGKTGTWWINETKTWGETNPVLVTAYVLQVLKRIHATL